MKVFLALLALVSGTKPALEQRFTTSMTKYCLELAAFARQAPHSKSIPSEEMAQLSNQLDMDDLVFHAWMNKEPGNSLIGAELLVTQIEHSVNRWLRLGKEIFGDAKPASDDTTPPASTCANVFRDRTTLFGKGHLMHTALAFRQVWDQRLTSLTEVIESEKRPAVSPDSFLPLFLEVIQLGQNRMLTPSVENLVDDVTTMKSAIERLGVIVGTIYPE